MAMVELFSGLFGWNVSISTKRSYNDCLQAIEGRMSEKGMTYQCTSEGMGLTSLQASKLESKLQSNPADITCRLKLLGYYFRLLYRNESVANKHGKSVCWLIENQPDAAVLSMPYCRVDKYLHEKTYEKCKSLWQKQIRKRNVSVPCLRNAAKFYQFYDNRRVKLLYEKSIKAEPQNAELLEQAAFFLFLIAKNDSSSMDRSLFLIQASLKNTSETMYRMRRLIMMSRIACKANKLALAKRAAVKAISEAKSSDDSSFQVDVIYEGNCMLGRIALKRGRLAEVEHYLKKIYEIGVHDWSSFALTMEFAQDLLDVEMREEACDYLMHCAETWIHSSKKLKSCIKLIRKGKKIVLQKELSVHDFKSKI